MRNRPHTSDARKPAQEIALPFFPAEKRKPTPTHLYALGCGPFVKIGVAIDVEVRLGILQKACPYEIIILKTVLRQDFDAAHSVELALHRQFAEHRTYGEWFAVPATDVLAAMASVEAYIPPPPPGTPLAPAPYVETDPQMIRMRAAAKSLEF